MSTYLDQIDARRLYVACSALLSKMAFGIGFPIRYRSRWCLTPKLTCCRKPKQSAAERSNCLGCQGCLVYFLVLNLLRLPGRPMLQHGLEHRQPWMPTRGARDFFDVP